MTKVARLFEEEKEAAVEQERKAKEQAVEQERKAKEQAVEQEKKLAREAAMETAMEMLKEGDSVEKVARCNKSLSINDVEKLKLNN